MDSSQVDFIIENVEITIDVNYCYFAVLSFLLYDTGMSHIDIEIDSLRYLTSSSSSPRR